MTLLFEEATPFGLEIFVSVSIFSFFFDVHPDSIPTKRPDQTIFVVRNVVFFPLGLEVSDQKKTTAP